MTSKLNVLTGQCRAVSEVRPPQLAASLVDQFLSTTRAPLRETPSPLECYWMLCCCDSVSAPTRRAMGSATGRDLPQRSGWARCDRLTNAALAAWFGARATEPAPGENATHPGPGRSFSEG